MFKNKLKFFGSLFLHFLLGLETESNKIYIQSVHRATLKGGTVHHWLQFLTWKTGNVCFPWYAPTSRPFVHVDVHVAFFSFQVARQPIRPSNSFYEDVSQVKFTKVDQILFIIEEVEAQTSEAHLVEKDLETKKSKQCLSVHLIISPGNKLFYHYTKTWGAAHESKGFHTNRYKYILPCRRKAPNNGWVVNNY